MKDDYGTQRVCPGRRSSFAFLPTIPFDGFLQTLRRKQTTTSEMVVVISPSLFRHKRQTVSMMMMHHQHVFLPKNTRFLESNGSKIQWFNYLGGELEIASLF
jgi:hypothetical protein